MTLLVKPTMHLHNILNFRICCVEINLCIPTVCIVLFKLQIEVGAICKSRYHHHVYSIYNVYIVSVTVSRDSCQK